jgi:hypothetical protein
MPTRSPRSEESSDTVKGSRYDVLINDTVITMDNIKMDLRETELSGMDWIDLVRIGTSGRLL